MKTQIALLFTISLIMIACANRAEGQVPDAVSKAFEAKYPGENDPDWETDANGYYESSFKIDGKHYRADFDKDGNWIETERSVEFDDLPKPVKKMIESEYDRSEITEIEEVEHPEKGLFYDIEFKRKGKNKDIMITKEGKVIN
ncbi:PepSY-like domain-containing protein [Zeaxanthinibacter enoshimensis]|uniref:PepSY-like domain-containing protein n=1 Tax=Zeaxanthinibacter enoshimensis TaxID=392009 RepID=UPI0035636B03